MRRDIEEFLVSAGWTPKRVATFLFWYPPVPYGSPPFNTLTAMGVHRTMIARGIIPNDGSWRGYPPLSRGVQTNFVFFEELA